MKVALIPPVEHLHGFGKGPFHLLLAHLLKRKKYKAHYIEQRRHGAYLVLDNSAHEKGRGEDPLELVKLGFEIDAQEIVVPDVLDDANGTIETCLQAHEEWFESQGVKDIMDAYSPAFMYVPQGKNREDWVQCLNDLVRIHLYCSRRHNLRRDLVLGISKDYDVWDGGTLRLIEENIIPLRYELAEKAVPVHVHLLGWSRNLWNLQEIASKHSWIRSTDSAKPFVYALSGIDLLKYRLKDPPRYPRRARGYFSQRMTKREEVMASSNVWVFEQLANGKLVMQ